LHRLRFAAAILFLILTFFHTFYITEDRVVEKNYAGVINLIEEEYATSLVITGGGNDQNCNEKGREAEFSSITLYLKKSIKSRIRGITTSFEFEMQGRQEERYFITSHFATST
jgi:hypothetical protein